MDMQDMKGYEQAMTRAWIRQGIWESGHNPHEYATVTAPRPDGELYDWRVDHATHVITVYE